MGPTKLQPRKVCPALFYLAAGGLVTAACSRAALPDDATSVLSDEPSAQVATSADASSPASTVDGAPPDPVSNTHVVEGSSEAAQSSDDPDTQQEFSTTEQPDVQPPASSEPADIAPASDVSLSVVDPNRTCSYRTYDWSTTAGRGVNHRDVVTTYGELADDERDPADPRCTICREDQALLDPAVLGIDGVDAVYVCAAWHDAIAEALVEIAESGFVIREIDGYRVGRTRGRVVDGLRTELSNHSYGAAIDINADDNGLYGNCNVSEVSSQSIADCDLRVGGEWDPEARPDTTIVAGGVVHRAFERIVGWRWGGEISGSTRDMMHFSPTGY
jgi:hypothetical protein